MPTLIPRYRTLNLDIPKETYDVLGQHAKDSGLTLEELCIFLMRTGYETVMVAANNAVAENAGSELENNNSQEEKGTIIVP